METQTGYRHRVVAADQRVALLLAYQLRQAVRVLDVTGMVLVKGKVIVVRPAAPAGADGVDTGCLANAADTNLDTCPEGVITGNNIVAVDLGIGQVPGLGMAARWTSPSQPSSALRTAS